MNQNANSDSRSVEIDLGDGRRVRLTVSRDGERALITTRKRTPGAGGQETVQVEIDLEATELRFDGRSIEFPIDAFSRYCLLNGIDQLGFLLENEAAITAYERTAAAPS